MFRQSLVSSFIVAAGLSFASHQAGLAWVEREDRPGRDHVSAEKPQNCNRGWR